MGAQSHYPVSLPIFTKPQRPLLSIVSPSVRPLSLLSDPLPVASFRTISQTSHIRNITQGRPKKRKILRDQGKSYRHSTTIDMLPDNVLLEVFDFCRRNHDYARRSVWDWHLLAHICRRWRQIVFESRHRLILQIFCTHSTPVRKNLDIWPAIPIVIDYTYTQWGVTHKDEDNVLAALEHPDRLFDLAIRTTGSHLGNLATVMQEPFPMLTKLHITLTGGNAPVLPAEFLGGSAPCLQDISLCGVPFPGPMLLLSASDLRSLDLTEIPPTGYIPPEAMVTFLAALPRLETFIIGFQSATHRPDRIRRPPVMRTVLRALTSIRFQGASEYLENLVAQIDVPQLGRMRIHYFNQLVEFQIAQLSKFINRSFGPEFTLLKHTQVTFFSNRVTFHVGRYSTDILCKGVDWQVSHMAQVLSHFSVTLSTVIHLRLKVHLPEDRLLEGTEDVEWLRLLHQFSVVKTLHVSRELAGHVALALEDLTGEMVTDALPSLNLIRLEGQPASSIEEFLSMRQLSGRPVTIADTEAEFYERLVFFVDEQVL